MFKMILGLKVWELVCRFIFACSVVHGVIICSAMTHNYASSHSRRQMGLDKYTYAQIQGHMEKVVLFLVTALWARQS